MTNRNQAVLHMISAGFFALIFSSLSLGSATSLLV